MARIFSSCSLRPTSCTETCAPSYISGSSIDCQHVPTGISKELGLTVFVGLSVNIAQWTVVFVYHVDILVRHSDRNDTCSVVKKVDPRTIT